MLPKFFNIKVKWIAEWQKKKNKIPKLATNPKSKKQKQLYGCGHMQHWNLLSSLLLTMYINNENSNLAIVTVCYYHIMYEFQSESTLYSLPECQGTPARSRCHIWNLSDYNRIRTHNHLVHKWKLNHLAKLANIGNCGSRILICIGNMFRHWQWCVKLFFSLTWRFSLSLWLYSLLFF